MDRLESMRILVAAADAGSLSGAGRRLGMPVATVSRKVSELEAQLEARLLVRFTRKLALTDAGRHYLAACRRILEDVDEAERAASGEYSAPRGDLAVTAPLVFGRLHVMPILIDFLGSYPEIEPPPWPVSVLFAGQRLLPQKVRAFLDCSVPRLKADLSRIAADGTAAPGRR